MTLLNARCFIAMNRSGSGSLELYTFSSDTGVLPSFANLNDSSAEHGAGGNHIEGSDSNGVAYGVASFHLPTVLANVQIIGMAISGYPASSLPGSPSASTITCPFILAPDAHLYVLDIWYQTRQCGPSSLGREEIMGTDPPFRCRLVIHARTLLECLDSKGVHAGADSNIHRFPPNSDSGHTAMGLTQDAVEFLWNEWGPKGTRLFHDELDDIPEEGASRDPTALIPR